MIRRFIGPPKSEIWADVERDMGRPPPAGMLDRVDADIKACYRADLKALPGVALEPHLFSASQVARGKPAPDLLVFAAGTLGVAPADCLVVEDSTAGVAAAVAAGMRAIGFTRGSHSYPGHRDGLRSAGASAIVGHMQALPGTIRDASAP